MRHCLFPLAVALTLGSTLLAGPLNPPAGPVAPTPGPEPRIAINAINTPGDADSLFRIAQPGSYYLTGNITGVVGKHGIEISAAGVTLDLMGFELRGVVGSFDGVSASGLDIDSIILRNGTVQAWGGDGVDLTATSGTNGNISGVTCRANGGSGFVINFISVVSRCVAANNGLQGFNIATGATVTECAAYGNLNDGINGSGNCAISGCVAYNNSGDGIQASDGSTITDCSASENSLNGIVLNTGGTVTGCGVHNNNANGIQTNDGCTITNCASRGNQLDGIYVTDSCIVMFNTSSLNGSGGTGAGIRVFGVDNRIEANNCVASDIGIDVDSAGNFIARNVCSGNTTFNWTVAAGNICLVIEGAPAAAINGDSGGVSPGSTNPNANYTY